MNFKIVFKGSKIMKPFQRKQLLYIEFQPKQENENQSKM